MLEALVLAVAAPSLEAFDNANLRLTKCGFAAFRSANEQDQSLDQFTRGLPSRCAGEIAGMRLAVVALETGRGKSRAAAEAAADSVIELFSRQFASSYARRAETEAQVRALERTIREEGKPNAQ